MPSGEQLGAGRRKRHEGAGLVHLEAAALDRELEARAVLGRAAAIAKQKRLVDFFDVDAPLNRLDCICDLEDPAWLLVATAGNVEKVGSQFLSLRQLAQGRVFSRRTSWQLSPIAAAISHLSSALLVGDNGYQSPKGPFFSEALDSTDSVRFSKFERFELLINFSGKRFCGFSRTGERVRFPIRCLGVRILPPQPAILTFSFAAHKMCE
jgi:hypothetical protein